MRKLFFTNLCCFFYLMKFETSYDYFEVLVTQRTHTELFLNYCNLNILTQFIILEIFIYNNLKYIFMKEKKNSVRTQCKMEQINI